MTNENKEIFETLLQLLEEKKFGQVKSMVADMNEVDVAEWMEDQTKERTLLMYRLLPKELAAKAFAYMEPDTQQKLIELFSDKELAFVMNELYVDDAADLLEELPASVVKRVLRVTSPQDRAQINQILNFPEESAGSVLTTEFVDLKAGMTVSKALAYIRAYGPDKETIYTCYVTDDQRHLEGVLTARELLLAGKDQLIGDLMETQVISAKTTDDQELVAHMCAKYDLIALPIVDSENRLVGIVTVDDAVDIMEQEATEDMSVMAAITPTDKPYFKIGVWETLKSRIPWLLLLMVSATFTGMIISGFESALAAQAVLVAFIPMLMDTGGNSGSQSSVTIIRSLSLGDVTFGDLARVVWKEIRVAVLAGGVLAIAAFIKILLIDNLLLQNNISLLVAAVVCITLFVTVCLAKVVGCTMPMLAQKLGFDPAVMASPFLTTVVDAFSLMIYFGVASALLQL